MSDRNDFCHRATLGIIVITAIIVTVDLFSDWWLFKDFCIYGGDNLTIPLGIFCVISSVLFAMEVRNCWCAFQMYRKSEAPDASGVYASPGAPSVEQKKLERRQETLSFLLLALEDLPCTVIMYIAFTEGSCQLFTRVFEESFTGNLALLGAFFSSLWKGLLAFRYCCNVCRCKYHDLKGPLTYCCCCCCRLVRPVVAIVVMSFAAYLYFTFNKRGQATRPECFKEVVNTSLTTTLAAATDIS